MIVYYGYCDNGLGEAPVNALSYALKHDDVIKSRENLNHHRCPSFQDYLKNTFAVLSPHDYRLTVDINAKHTDDYDQQYYEKNVFDRGELFFSYVNPPIIFFCEESLIVEQIPAIYSTNQNPDLNFVFGKFNVGKHFRKLEYAAFANKPTVFEAEAGKPLYYVKFQTDEKITFKRFLYTPEMDSIAGATMDLRNYCGREKVKPLRFYYDRFKKYFYDKKLLELIKANIIE